MSWPMVVTEVSILKAIGSALFAMATANGRTRSLRAGWHAVARKAELGRPMMCYCFTLPAYASGMSCWRWLRQSPTFPYRQGRDAMVFVRGLVFAVSFVIAAAAARAQTAAVSATCKDGSPWSGAHRSGACRGHGGVQAFDTSPAQTAMPPNPSTQSTPSPATASVAATPAPTAAQSGSAGQVWVNTSSKVYHCQGDRDYGHTKKGSYMTEAAAKAAGARPSRGKVCS